MLLEPDASELVEASTRGISEKEMPLQQKLV
jgi:hypothetical protein